MLKAPKDDNYYFSCQTNVSKVKNEFYIYYQNDEMFQLSIGQHICDAEDFACTVAYTINQPC